MFVGVDAHIAPAKRTVFSEIFGEFVTSERADVGIGPYIGYADSHKAFLFFAAACCDLSGATRRLPLSPRGAF